MIITPIFIPQHDEETKQVIVALKIAVNLILARYRNDLRKGEVDLLEKAIALATQWRKSNG